MRLNPEGDLMKTRLMLAVLATGLLAAPTTDTVITPMTPSDGGSRYAFRIAAVGTPSGQGGGGGAGTTSNGNNGSDGADV